LNQQLAQIGELTAGVVHEVRNPLSVISGMAELLMRKLGQEHPFYDQAALIFQEAGQLEKLVNQFLGFAKPFQVEKRRCAPEAVVDRAVRLCARMAQEKGVAVTVATAAGIPYIEADEAKLAQALANIVQNAVEIVGVEGAVGVHTLVREGTLVFRVEDNGPGIQLSDGENLLSPFFSKKQAGTGLGLSIVHRIITAHGGAVKYGNRDEGGAWFELRLSLDASTG
jgi:signal transduction histidine kinase